MTRAERAAEILRSHGYAVQVERDMVIVVESAPLSRPSADLISHDIRVIPPIRLGPTPDEMLRALNLVESKERTDRAWRCRR